jgi:hypothetical protein
LTEPSGSARRQRLIAVCVVASTAAVSASRPEKTFVLGIEHDIDSLNPFVGVQVEGFEAYQLLYDTLTSRGPTDSRSPPTMSHIPFGA